jgi:acetyltransferase-like isoleucine patch superfamily enzyme
MRWLKDSYPQYTIGAWTYGAPRIIHYSPSTLRIGKFCSIADNVSIILGGEHRTDWLTTFPFASKYMRPYFPEAKKVSGHPEPDGDIIIGNDVWIGYGAIILPGSNIHDGAVIGAGAVVRDDIPPYRIAIGSPIKLIKSRFTPAQIKQLLDLKWWDWPIEKIQKNIKLLCSPNITEFLNQEGKVLHA